MESFKNEVSSLRSDLTVCQRDYKRESSANQMLKTRYVTEDNYLSSFLSIANKEVKAVTAEYAQCCAELKNVELALQLCQNELKLALESRQEDRVAAVEAATVATSASIRRAELEVETDGMIQVIDLRSICCV